MKNKIATLLLSSFLLATSVSAAAASSPGPGFPLADGVDTLATSSISSSNLSAPAPGFPLADGVDTLASTEAKVQEFSTNESRGISLQSVKSYNSPGFYTGLYIGGSSSPTVFALNSSGYAVYSSIYQANLNAGESVQVTYQTLNANTGNTLAGKSLSGIQSSGKVDISTKVQSQTAVYGYMHNFTGNHTAVSGNFNY
ncbi:hypothetical protein [Paenibacillus sp. 2KB_22]|uniref:hypothetical protein n=1 Tax=Paenibacillus sp. 2KB_22 TaxID=3232978 RepID=UPI003F99DCFD